VCVVVLSICINGKDSVGTEGTRAHSETFSVGSSSMSSQLHPRGYQSHVPRPRSHPEPSRSSGSAPPNDQKKRRFTTPAHRFPSAPFFFLSHKRHRFRFTHKDLRPGTEASRRFRSLPLTEAARLRRLHQRLQRSTGRVGQSGMGRFGVDGVRGCCRKWHNG